ncbi:Bifunctional D-cysteine desulfhydrase/1-aminocyclopropane-1-carboxylate deaminase-mitochondrial [Striga hermonthica]|uniref:Bifunctional D-cysteine desulfhydrase/1-aminocyclopropane-1-carboxylate deaminase-mitochondrial n=1 Tax=Striga hermonthica TaxID=68872 RepID=A0A9N7MX52_STRHE|nr:Bifunctional D-cysteine desulfhydrase/1-aminocyclopropane-1-carboxylate deaminase-mitochondrial [Striga hermonthica]
MLCCRYPSPAPLSSSPFTTINNNKIFSDKQTHFRRVTHSQAAANYITKSGIQMDSAPKSGEPTLEFLAKKPYAPPSWASHLNPLPSHIFSLGHFPTPIHKWNLPNLPKNTEVYLKRDDLSGMQLSGNKVRKLEFLMADAVEKGADCIITIGGIQSNHCRATAVAARYLNLDCYLILRTSKVLVDQDPGLTGNLLVERLVGAHIDLVSKEEYASVGSVVCVK